MFCSSKNPETNVSQYKEMFFEQQITILELFLQDRVMLKTAYVLI